MAINPRTENLQHKLTTYIPLVIPSQEKPIKGIKT